MYVNVRVFTKNYSPIGNISLLEKDKSLSSSYLTQRSRSLKIKEETRKFMLQFKTFTTAILTIGNETLYLSIGFMEVNELR